MVLWYAWHSIPTGNGLSRKTLPIVTDVEWSVCLSPTQTAGPIEKRFGEVGTNHHGNGRLFCFWGG